MINNNIDPSQFEDNWRRLCIEICQAIYIKPEAQKLKGALQKNGFLSLEERSQFIDICNQVKYQVIQKDYGVEGSEGYKSFSEDWKHWFQTKGVESENSQGQRNSIDHLMFGSTPDPQKFLLHFEHEVLGSYK